jgi:Pentapeptide repeats (9 copies)
MGVGRDSKGVGWPPCSEDDCNGIRLDAGGKCLAHADGQQLDAELKRLGDEGTIDARGVTISAELLNRILEAAPRDAKQPDRPCFNKVRFERATFGDQSSFAGATFGDRAEFGRATFGRGASFDFATFGDDARFVGATFGDWARFGRATFGRGAWFVGATFGDEAGFSRATFGDSADFVGATFGNWGGFIGATFGNRAEFNGATFGDRAGFYRTTFGDEAEFVGATFGDDARFDGAIFGDWARFGPLLGRGRLVLGRAVFGGGCEVAISADRLDCRGTRLPYGAVLRLRWAEAWLEGVEVGRPSVLAGVDPFPGLDEGPLRPRVTRSWRTERPRVQSLQGSDVRNLVLSNVDLRGCRFSGAHNLDQLRLEATIDLADPPTDWRVGWAMLPLWRWTRRRTLAEEQRWRRAQAKHAGWYPRACRARGLAQQERALRPADIALLYRALRKGREDSKDEPGAADFYYGEMEMRRHDQTAPWSERVVLWLYWLFAGYGLRASRALGWLLGVLAAATVLLATVGFAPARSATPLGATITGTPPQQHIQLTTTPPPEVTAERPLAARLGTAVLVAVEGAVFRTSDQALTYRGRLIQAGLRFVGPVLLGLALLSIRGRVKR